jgi:hypothetical protein
MSDISMHLCHAVPPPLLDSPTSGEDKMLEVYFSQLSESGVAVDRPKLERQYKLGCVDYFRFMTGRFYGFSTPESYEKSATNRNVALINRSPKAAFAFAERVEGYVRMFEAEFAALT